MYEHCFMYIFVGSINTSDSDSSEILCGFRNAVVTSRLLTRCHSLPKSCLISLHTVSSVVKPIDTALIIRNLTIAFVCRIIALTEARYCAGMIRVSEGFSFNAAYDCIVFSPDVVSRYVPCIINMLLHL